MLVSFHHLLEHASKRLEQDRAQPADVCSETCARETFADADLQYDKDRRGTRLKRFLAAASAASYEERYDYIPSIITSRVPQPECSALGK